jgi:membrane protein
MIQPAERSHGRPADRANARAARPSGRKAVRARAEGIKGHLERYAPFRVAESVARGIAKDRVTNAAAAMTYYGIFSLFPLLLLFMALAGLALQSNAEAREQILSVVVGLLPQGQDELQHVIAGVIDTKGAAAGFGLLALLWSALGWFQVIDYNVNQIWGVDKPRSFVKGKLFALAMVIAIGGVALTSWMATAAIGLLSAYTDVIPGSAVLWQVAVSLLSVLTISGAFLVLYRFTPRRQIDLADVWPAALTTALLWESTRRIIAFYLAQNDMISGYGPIGAAMALLFWVYISSIIILLGAEIGYAIAKERRRIPPAEEMVVVAAPGEQPTPKFAPQTGRGLQSR